MFRFERYDGLCFEKERERENERERERARERERIRETERERAKLACRSVLSSLVKSVQASIGGSSQSVFCVLYSVSPSIFNDSSISIFNGVLYSVPPSMFNDSASHQQKHVL